jgi:hypothetical protein
VACSGTGTGDEGSVDLHRRAALTAILSVTLVLAACSDSVSTDPTTTTVAGPTTTPADGSTTTTLGGDATVPTTAAPTTTTTTTTIVPTAGTLSLTRIVFLPVPYVTVTNVGNEPVDLGDHWLVAGGARHRLPARTVATGDTVVLGLGDEAPPDVTGVAATIDLGPVLGPVVVEDGEMALFSAAQFAEPAAVVDYVEWGSSGHRRSAVAVAAGLWEERAFVAVPPEAQALSSSGEPTAGPEDWTADVGG